MSTGDLPGWAIAAINVVAALSVAIYQRWKTISVGKEVILKTSSPEQVTRVDEGLTKRLKNLEVKVEELATRDEVNNIGCLKTAELERQVTEAVKASIKGFAKGQPRSEATVVKSTLKEE